jgi:hypothetical protein
MVATIGEAYSLGWKIRGHCAWGKRDGMKSILECVARVTVDLETLVWTRGQGLPDRPPRKPHAVHSLWFAAGGGPHRSPPDAGAAEARRIV